MMIRVVIGFCLLTGLGSCKRAPHQQIQLKNTSSAAIYFLVSADSILSNSNDIWQIRPITTESDLSKIDELLARAKDDPDLYVRMNRNLYRYRIAASDSAILISSESAEIFVDAMSVHTIINQRYNGQMNVFVISEKDLSENSDETIIERKLYRHVARVTEKSMTGDTTTIQYF
jgi:hypothetical protein